MKVILTFMIAILFQLFPISLYYQWLMPNLIVLTLIFWMIYSPGTINMYHIFLLGLFCDALFGTVLGEHGVGFLVTGYCVYRFLRPLRVWPVWQHFILIFLILYLYYFVRVLIKVMQGYEVTFLHHVWLTPFIALVFWPLIRNIFIHFIPKTVK